MTAHRSDPAADSRLLGALHDSLGHAPERDLLAAADALEAVRPTPAGIAERAKAALTVEPVACLTTRYRCPFCRRFSRTRKAAVADHMTRCWLNPAVRACKTCAFFQPGNRLAPSNYCQPGEICSCGVDEESCEHEDGPDLSGTLRDGCPLWALRGAS